MAKLIGIIGFIVICAGADLLWQCRAEIRFWLAAYVRVFCAMLEKKQSADPVRLPGIPGHRHGAVRFLLGVGCAFLLGPLLLALGVTLMILSPES